MTPEQQNRLRKRQYFSITELCMFKRCPRRYFYRCVEGLTTPEPSIPMFYGTCIHKAIGTYFLTWDYGAMVDCFNQTWGGTIGDEKRNPELAKLILYAFANAHPKGGGLYEPLSPPSSDIKIDQGDKVSDLEIPFAIDIGLPIPLLGRVDGWCRSRMTGDIWLNEYKTTAEMSDRFFNGFKRNPQVMGYVAAIRSQAPKDKHPVGVFLEAISTAKTKWEVRTQPIEVMPWEADRFISWAQTTGQYILDCEARGEWQCDPSGCAPYAQFGSPGYLCEYDGLCSVPDWKTMKDFYKTEYHVPYVIAKENP